MKIQSRSGWAGCLLALILVASACIAHADTIVPPGNVSGTWAIGGSPYILTGNINVTDSLIIEPAVAVRVQAGGWKIEVASTGRLRAVGTEAKPIVFEPYSGQEPGLWTGITIIESSDDDTLTYCVVRRATNGIYAFNCEPIISHCEVYGNLTSGIQLHYERSDSGAVISECEVYDNTYGIALTGMGRTGGDIATAVIDHCTIHRNSVCGILVSTTTYWVWDYIYEKAEISNCTLFGNKVGVQAYTDRGNADASIVNTIIAFSMDYAASNRDGGCLIDASDITYSSFWGNALGNWSGIANSGILTPGCCVNAQGDTCDINQNIYYDPMFADTADTDFRILSMSKCVDAGNPVVHGTFRQDPDATVPDIGSHYYDQRFALPEIVCPPGVMEKTDCGSGQICVSLPIFWAWEVYTGAASWTGDSLCFAADVEGRYDFTVIASNVLGSDTCHVAVDVEFGDRPEACFTAAVTGTAPPYTVAFSNCSTPTDASCTWVFGDGATSHDVEPEHPYEAPGEYVVTLTVANDCGTDIFADTVKVSASTNGTLCFRPDSLLLAPDYEACQSTVELWVDDAENVMGVHARIAYDQTKIRIGCLEAAEFLKRNGGTVIDRSTFDNSMGELEVNMTAAGGRPAGMSGSGAVLDITFYALDEDPAGALVIESASLRDPENHALSAGTEDGAVGSLDCDILCDFDADCDVDFADYTLFVSHWNEDPDNTLGDIAGPITGEHPGKAPWCRGCYLYPGDGIIDFEDQMVFTIMYNWQKLQPICPEPGTAPTVLMATSARDRFAIDVPDAVVSGERFAVRISLLGTSDVVGWKTVLRYDSDALMFLGSNADAASGGGDVLISCLDRTGTEQIEIGMTVLGTRGRTEATPITAELWFEANLVEKASIEVVTVDLRTADNRSLDVDPGQYEGTREIAVATGGQSVPQVFALRRNMPNPFENETCIGFDLPVACTVNLEVFDAQGRKVRSLVNEAFGPGYHQASWNGQDDGQRPVGSGIYFIRMEAADFRAMSKMLLAR